MDDHKSRHATIVDVAQAANVSVATAGRALGDYGYVRPETKKAVLSAAQALNYKKNIAAQALISGSARTFGMIVSDLSSEFYSNIIKSAVNYSRRHGYCVLIYDTHESLAIEKEAVAIFQKHRVDGIIIAPASMRSIGHLRDFVAGGGRIVQIDRRLHGLAGDSVTLDNRRTAAACTTRLLDAGHRRIAYIGELDEIKPADLGRVVTDHAVTDQVRKGFAPSFQRLMGYLDAHRDAGVPVCADLVGRTGNYSWEAAHETTQAVLRHVPTGLLTSDGLMTVGAFRAVRAEGKRIPDDISFMSFDDLEWLQFVDPPVSAVAQPCAQIGEEAARILIAMARGAKNSLPPQYEHVQLNGSIVDRGSVRVITH
ncbi:LacI family DNA-binding transcriptional regulator [Gluconacetobacter sp. 1c LMG 22058]|uniref:LacI family DNA-binding transcriptional regulator n=1 Tax=Gluconacetobacter dulcium TaxID=2729096 RepID=A0A7W4K2E5_9PROT|nr:LacI family DNA-binding transcriptional regulator [Gluconacetobacter dulcium]MBB2199131.1 LacI family DNA-binding transcriptional regulator [Gluconacetobacter dulcium]